MAIGSNKAPWWNTETVTQFDEFGFTNMSPAWMLHDEITFTIMLFDGQCSTYDECRARAHNLCEKAIAKANNLYDLRAAEFRIIQRSGHPIEASLEMTIAENRES